MELWTCFINPFHEKQLIRNDVTKEEYWVDLTKISDTLFWLHNEKGLEKVWIEGPYVESYDLIWQYRNAYPADSIDFTIN